jgi:putative heme-binding domain-containing protein
VTRFRRREILESVMYPSKVISDQYSAVRVEVDNDVVIGMLADETSETLTLIDATGQRIDIPKGDILDRRPSSVSIMPEGLLDVMSLEDLVDLMIFLERGVDGIPEPAVAATGAGDR